jgi:general secretion pathway protein H
MKRDGVTLIELLIVLFIIGIASALVGILITQRTGNVELRTLTREMLATLRYARSHAISEKKIYSFVIHKNDRIYSLYTEVTKDKEGEELIPLISKTIPEKFQISFNGSKEDPFKIDFFPQGNSSGGVIKIEDEGGASFSIIVSRIGGKAKIEKS